MIYHLSLPSFTVTRISFAVVYSSVSEMWYVNFGGLIFGPGIFEETLDIFFVSIFIPLDHPRHFKSSIPLLGAPTAVILILIRN